MEMNPTRGSDTQIFLADILLEMEATLQELCHYYRFERHKGAFPAKVYFLFSQCAHLLYCLWRAQRAGATDAFQQNARLSALVSGLDFGELGQASYRGRAPHRSAHDGYLQNQSVWFTFWLRALQEHGGAKPPECDEFSQQVLSHTRDPGFLEGKIGRRQNKALAHFLRTDAVARLLDHSTVILEGLTSAIVIQLTSLDPNFHMTEQMASLVCMLRQARRIIIYETPAQGPYVLCSNRSWGVPSPLFRMGAKRKSGTLKVVPRRDGAGIACTYRWTMQSQSGTRSWMQATSALSSTYEEELFRTWSYDTGEHCERGSFDASKAHWLVQSVEARRLRIIFHHVETILGTLAVKRRCAGLIAEVAQISVDRQEQLQASKLEWTYIKKLDQLLKTLNTAYWEARLLGGNNPGEEIIAIKWPPAFSTQKGVESSHLHASCSNERLQSALPFKTVTHSKREESLDNAAAKDQGGHEEAAVPEKYVIDAHADATLDQQVNSGGPRGAMSQPSSQVCLHAKGLEDRPQPEDVAPARDRRPTASLGSYKKTPADVQHEEETTIPDDQTTDTTDQHTESQPSSSSLYSHETRNQQRQDDPSLTGQSNVSSLQLILELAKRHQPRGGSVNYDPVSRKQLQQALGWTQSTIQRMMTDVFGRRPFAAYKQKCRDRTICDFLKEATLPTEAEGCLLTLLRQ
jgi:hypothetical protein